MSVGRKWLRRLKEGKATLFFNKEEISIDGRVGSLPKPGHSTPNQLAMPTSLEAHHLLIMSSIFKR